MSIWSVIVPNQRGTCAERTRVAFGRIRRGGIRKTMGVAAACCVVVGCKDLTNDPGLPAGTPNPSFYSTADGAIGLRTAAIYDMNLAVPQYLVDAGLLSDELIDRSVGSSFYTGSSFSGISGTVTDALDERLLPEGVTAPQGDGIASYAYLQSARGAANVALGALATYDTTAASRPQQRVMRGELYALEGYAEILLAEFFCSGVPLSTLDYQQDFTYGPSSTAAQVYTDANTKLDSALVLSVGTDSVLNLARVLHGRAQLNLGNYAAAADDVALVPPTFQYRVTIQASSMSGPDLLNQRGTVSDREGGNGLPFLSSGDPRTATTVRCQPPDSRCPLVPLTMPAKYFSVITAAGYAPFVVADGIEAQLIQAEAQLQPASAPGGPWLTTLNQLRESIGLVDTTDPGTAAARVALLFHERAYWLFLTGHRQGDLRRLIRQYGSQPQFPEFRSDQQVYPTGLYPAPGTGRYGSDVTVPIPTTEYANPNYHGCRDRSA